MKKRFANSKSKVWDQRVKTKDGNGDIWRLDLTPKTWVLLTRGGLGAFAGCWTAELHSRALLHCGLFQVKTWHAPFSVDNAIDHASAWALRALDDVHQDAAEAVTAVQTARSRCLIRPWRETTKPVVRTTQPRQRIRTAPDGRQSLFDLLAAEGCGNPRDVWQRLQRKQPTLRDHVSNHTFTGQGQHPTVTVYWGGWEVVRKVLLGADYQRRRFGTGRPRGSQPERAHR